MARVHRIAVPSPGSPGLAAVGRLRRVLSPSARRRVRRLVDPVLASALGSWNASTAQASVALTLDDGPDADVTPALLDRFAELDVRATYFLLTLEAERHPALVERITAAGHEIALHGLDHRRVSVMTGEQARAYLAEARERLEQVAGRSVHLFRPPFGAQSVRSLRAARGLGLDVVVWNGDAADWVDRPAAEVLADADTACRPGGIFLFHERLEPDPDHPDPVLGAPSTTFDRVEVLGELVERLRSRRLEPVRVSDLARDGRLLRSAWLRP